MEKLEQSSIAFDNGHVRFNNMKENVRSIPNEMDLNSYTSFGESSQNDAGTSLEELRQVQTLNQQYITALSHSSPVDNNFPGNQHFHFGSSKVVPHEGRSSSSSEGQGPSYTHGSHGNLSSSIQASKDENNLFGGMRYQGGVPSIEDSFEDIDAFLMYEAKSSSKYRDEPNDDEFDKFFSNTESDELEKFLDNLANSKTTDPLKFYNIYDQSDTTRGPIGHPQMNRNAVGDQPTPKFKEHLSHEDIKNELAEAFGQPLSKNFSKSPTSSSDQDQLATPSDSKNSYQLEIKDESLNSSSRKRSYVADAYDGISASPKKRRRASTKPLLSLEQKKSNHSYSEQKRRQMCKFAYERCLKLIVNIEEYNREQDNNKKSKRAKINKYGLPNLSKHTALIKISHEIMRIKSKNDKLKQLLSGAII